jgi:tRNA A37 threonylcarbamoyladenosine biosynthesis protein TsaE
MLIDEFIYQATQELGVVPTEGQREVLEVCSRFLSDRNPNSVMLLRGSAGTGKTSLAAALVRTMKRWKQKTMLLAPTGRAAKVFSLYSGSPAFTIHRCIYRQRSVEGGFNLNYNSHSDTLFIIDEASMISTDVLPDLIHYVHSGTNCRMLVIGDNAQLPPVGEAESAALVTQYYRDCFLNTYEADLNEVLRQSNSSGILWNATMLRSVTELPLIRFHGFADIHVVTGDELIETLASSYSHVGIDETMVITRSNKRANIYNIGIRNTILDREEELSRGDQLMIVKNKYLKKPLSSTDNGGNQLGTFIANGDRAVVQRVRNIRELYGFRFADVAMTFPDYDDSDFQTTVILDTLCSEAPALTPQQSTQLFNAVLDDYADLPTKGERLKQLREDEYYNAMQVKYGYAVTCHKAQGGQWAHVYVDQGFMTDDMLSPDYFHWLYTAFTRATEQLYLVNWPKTQIEGYSE